MIDIDPNSSGLPGIEQLRIGQCRIAKAQLGERRALLPQCVADGQAGPGEELHQQRLLHQAAAIRPLARPAAQPERRTDEAFSARGQVTLENAEVRKIGRGDPAQACDLDQAVAAPRVTNQGVHRQGRDQCAAGRTGEDERARGALGVLQPGAGTTDRLRHGLDRVFLCNSGTEAMEAAKKFAITGTGRQKFVAMKRGFSGRTLGALALTWEPKYREPFGEAVDSKNVTHITYGNIEELRAAVTEDVAAVIIELLRRTGRTGGDLALAVMFYGGIAAGVVILAKAPGGGSASLASYLFGAINTVTHADLTAFAWLAALVVLTVVVMRSRFFAVAQDEEYARATGMPVRLATKAMSSKSAHRSSRYSMRFGSRWPQKAQASSRVQPWLASRTSLRLGRRSSSSRISASSSRMG